MAQNKKITVSPKVRSVAPNEAAQNESTDEDVLEVDESVEEEGEAEITFDIASYPSDLTLSVVYEMWKSGDIQVPDFQRNFVWKIKQSSLLIESFLLGLPVPQVFFYVDDENKSLVIDGQQRILSVVYYLDGYFGSESIHGKKQVFRLQGLAPSSPFFRKRFDELSDAHQRKLKSAVLRAINIRQLAPHGETTSVYHIFERLNTGGTPLTAQEIRNCVFRGGLLDLLGNLNRDRSWRKIVGKNNLDKHQKDVELILRVFALTYFFDVYEKPLKEFLNKSVARERDGDSARAKKFQDKFPSVAKTIADSLGTKPFHIRGPLNSSALDAVFAVLMSARATPPDLKPRFRRLIADKIFEQTTFVSTSDASVVKLRLETARKYLLD